MSNSNPTISLTDIKSMKDETKQSASKEAEDEVLQVDKVEDGKQSLSIGQRIEAKIKKMTTPSAVKGGEYFGTPGAGDSRLIGVFSTLFFIGLWAFVTEGGLVKAMFLPSPIDVVIRLWDVTIDGFAGATLVEHLNASLIRIFGAFFAHV
ncbi:hypothetical protein ACLKMH_24395 [Psychromonas sp. KJ10-10]|uniref:hypothetical protein n=1 Tax=Psychromonas sp. KJ10-10 TaxID=3391823 RepID=UPI0039B537FC